MPRCSGGCCRRAITALGYGPPVVVVRPGEHPAFWLRLHDQTTPRELEIGVLDAVALLLGRRVAIAVEAAPERPS